MRRAKLTTRRWRRPSSLRRARFAELLALTKYNAIFDKDFFLGLERRIELLESRQLKAMGIQIPLFLFLAFSLLHIDVNFRILGISADVSKSLREILLLVTTTISVGYSRLEYDLLYLKEMLTATITKQAGDNEHLRNFLEIRYGLSEIAPGNSFDDDLRIGSAQVISLTILLFGRIIMISMIVIILLTIQVWNIIEVYAHPNFAREISIFVIIYVLLGDILFLTYSFLVRSVQPYQTDEDFRKLVELRKTNEEEYDTILRKMVLEHGAKGLLGRLFGRPRLRRFENRD